MNATKYILPIVLMSAPAMAQEALFKYEFTYEETQEKPTGNSDEAIEVSEADVLKEILANLKKQNKKKKDSDKAVNSVGAAPEVTDKQPATTFTAGTSKRDNSNDVLRDDITGVINDLQFARNGVVELYRKGQIHQQEYQRMVNSLLKTQNTLSDLYPARIFARAAEYERYPVEQALYEARIACIDFAFAQADVINKSRLAKSIEEINSLEEACSEKAAAYEAAKEKLYKSDRAKPQNVAANTFNERNIFSGSLETGVDTDDQMYVGFVGGWNFEKNGLRKLELLAGGRVYTNGAGEESHKTITQGNPDGSSSKLERDITTTNVDITGDLRVRYVLGDSDSFHYAPVTGVRGHINLSNEEIDAESSFTTPNGDVTLIPLNPEENSTVQTSAGLFIGVDGCYSRICVTPELELRKGGKDIKAGAGFKYQF